MTAPGAFQGGLRRAVGRHLRGFHPLTRGARVRRWLAARRTSVVLLVYALAALAAYTGAFLLRFDFDLPTVYGEVFLRSLPLLLVVRLTCARLLRLSAGRWRYVGLHDVRRLALSTVAGTVVFALAASGPFLRVRVPVSVIVLDAILYGLGVACVWAAYRGVFQQVRRMGTRSGRKRVVIVGAGEAGSMLAHEMSASSLAYRPVGFLDDNPFKWGTTVNGIEVIGATHDLAAVARAVQADEVVIAIPSATPGQLRHVVESCETADLPFRVLPGIADVLAGKVRLDHLREVRIEDLLGREPIQLELPELALDLRGRSVLVTGAAGSIGSELSRQVALHEPETLVLFDHAETSLYYLELELRERHPGLRLVPVIGDVVDSGAVERVFRAYAPDRVFHAAAYKHVPMMELNAREAVRNNVIGTWRVADAAGRHGVGKFVLVSTDKAVRPVSIMGATKRLSEMVVLELQERHPDTAYAAVRFGNVLGSNGSVIPIFKRQMEAGKPLTVTHPDATRYFMTIPEAVQLILQASLLPELRGHIAMLEMGDPVRIVDLARNLLRLSGNSSDPRRSLHFTGLRPGERLHEELVAPDERTVPTPISKVRLVETSARSDFPVWRRMREWEAALGAGDDAEVLASVGALFPGLQDFQRRLAGELEGEAASAGVVDGVRGGAPADESVGVETTVALP